MTDDKTDPARRPPSRASRTCSNGRWSMARAQQMMMEAWADNLAKGRRCRASGWARRPPAPTRWQWMSAGAEAWSKGLEAWSKMLGQASAAGEAQGPPLRRARVERESRSSTRCGKAISRSATNCSARSRRSRGSTKRRAAACASPPRSFVDAMSPANFAALNPQVMKRTIETKGENLLAGPQEHARRHPARAGHPEPRGRVRAWPQPCDHPGQGDPRNAAVPADPVCAVDRRRCWRRRWSIFPPWINRFYILDLTPEKSFVKWTVDQGVTLFMVSWKSADESIADVTQDDYVAAQLDAIDVIRDLLGVEAVHAIGYCVAGTTLAATPRLPRGEGRGGQGRQRDLLHRAGRFRGCGRPQAVPRRRDDGDA